VPPIIDRIVPHARIGVSRVANRLRDYGLPLPPSAFVVYHESYATQLQGGMRHTFDGRRPLRIVEQLRHVGAISRRQLIHAEPATDHHLRQVHPPHFLAQLRKPQTLAELFHLSLDEVRQRDDLLESFLYQTGGTLLALERALRARTGVFNLGGGFHHAQRDRAEGFCPLNDIAVAIAHVRRLGLAQRVLVVDLDFHHGNGTALIFADDEDVFTLSIHGQHWAQIEGKRNNLDVELPPGTEDAAYLRQLKEMLPAVLERFRPQAALYVAGADPHIRDPLGDFRISEDGMLERDLYVWQSLRRAHVPLAVVLAGGYGPWAWTIPYNFICSVLTRTRIPERYRPSNVDAHFQRVGRRLGPADLRAGDTALSEAQLEQLMSEQRASDLFMGTYTLEGVETALEAYGTLDRLRERGFANLLLSLDTADPQRQTLRIHFDERDADHLLIEMIVRYRTLRPPASAPFAPTGQNMLNVEWLCMQNPRASFTLDRPRLPGQRFPGLGLGQWAGELLRMMAERLGCAGLVVTPAHYHNARLYTRQMRFWDPLVQGRFEAIERLLADKALPEVAWIADRGEIVDATTGQPLRWEGFPQVRALNAPLRDYFSGERYRQLVQRARVSARYELKRGP
jgi:acetoin utilization deacetylase AcuC-like enzyme